MRRIIVAGLLILLIVPKTAFALPEELLEELPQEVQDIWEISEQENPQDTWRNGLRQLWRKTLDFLQTGLRDNLRSAALVLFTAILCGIAECVYQSTGDSRVPNFIPLAGTLVITGIMVGNIESMIGLGRETISQLHVLSGTLLPALSAAVSASGGIVSAATYQVITILCSEMMISLIQKLLLPLLNILIILSAADSILPEQHLGEMAEIVRKVVTWLLTGMLVLFTGYLALSGAAAGAADNLTVRMARSAISAAVPVVGGIISDATGSVLAGAAILKSSIGILGMLGVLTLCIEPFLTVGLQYLLYKVTALFAGITGESLSGYINALSSVFGLLLGMVGSCALLLLISICSSVSVVIA